MEVVPQPAEDGRMYPGIHDPLTAHEAQLLTAAPGAYPRAALQPCEECCRIKRQRSDALRVGDLRRAAEMATAMGVHQRLAHT
ncbi:hypothetical protein GCM10010218_31910 [Streptomyces mashuensis]|uniref:Uncharacterized protein n=1 Tax=Streptomyces mashuensis TaxID=33904 RepID=A0A919B3H5_9ACTN|nr:hypothetical protein GCM10010218_31910 [Streptomyces mashuensis]